MKPHVVFPHENIVVLYSGLDKPTVHLAVIRTKDRCDSCSLQADCDALFGSQGKDCLVYHKGRSWTEVPDEVFNLR